jgi:hypothetical protein
MRVSTLAWWPGKIPAGSVSSEIMATIDLLPTISKLAGQPVPTDRIIDGHDVSALLFGKPGAKSPHDGLYYEKDGIRQGKWKLVHYRIKANCFTELYDLNADLDEKKQPCRQIPGQGEGDEGRSRRPRGETQAKPPAPQPSWKTPSPCGRMQKGYQHCLNCVHVKNALDGNQARKGRSHHTQ